MDSGRIEHWATTITYEELTGRKPSIEDLRDAFRPFALGTVLLGFSRLTAQFRTWQNDINPELDTQLTKALIPELFQQVVAAKRRAQAARFVFNRPAFLFTIQQACLVCSLEGKLVETQADVGCLLRACVMANDLYLGEKSTNEPTTLSLAASLIPYADFISRDLYPQETARSLIMFEDILPRLAQPRSSPSPAGLFERRFGVSLREYCELTLCCSTRFILGTNEQFDPTNNALILTEKFFHTTKLPYERVQKFLSRISITLTKLTDEMRKFEAEPNNFTTLQAHPLVELEPGCYICLDPGFLLDKSGKALFWSVRAEVDEAGGRALLDVWGKVFEDYLCWLIRQAYRGDGEWIVKPTFEKGSEEFDLIYRHGSALLLIEAKASVLDANTKYDFDQERLKDLLERKFIEGSPGNPKGVKQLERGLQRLLDGQVLTGKNLLTGESTEVHLTGVKSVYPVLVVLDSAFMAPFLARYLKERFEKPRSGTHFRKKRVTPLFVLHVTDFEDLLPLTLTLEVEDALNEYSKVCRSSPEPLRIGNIQKFQSVIRGTDPLKEKHDDFVARLEQRTFDGCE